MFSTPLEVIDGETDSETSSGRIASADPIDGFQTSLEEPNQIFDPLGFDECTCLPVIETAPLTRRAGKRIHHEFPYNYVVGDCVDVASNNVWCPCKVIEVYSDREMKFKDGRKSCFSSGIVVSYIGWSAKFNESIEDSYRVDVGGSKVFTYKAWINLPKLPPWPCVVYDRGIVRNNKEARLFLKTEFKVYIQVCGNKTKYLKPYFDGFWYDAKCVLSFSPHFDVSMTSGKLICHPNMRDNWRCAIGQLIAMEFDQHNYNVTDSDFQFDGTYLKRYEPFWYTK
jgi:hypothetical protein